MLDVKPSPNSLDNSSLIARVIATRPDKLNLSADRYQPRRRPACHTVNMPTNPRAIVVPSPLRLIRLELTCVLVVLNDTINGRFIPFCVFIARFVFASRSVV